MPRVLMRLPYQPTAPRERLDGFVEDVAEDVARGPDHSKFLWGGAAFALGAVILRAFENAGWPANIRGVQRGVDAGGLVSGLPVDEPGTDSPGVAHKYTTDVVITRSSREAAWRSRVHPAVPLLRHAVRGVLFGAVHPETTTRWIARRPNANARLSSMIPYMLCVSRFAHYIKVMGRDRVGPVKSTDAAGTHSSGLVDTVRGQRRQRLARDEGAESAAGGESAGPAEARRPGCVPLRHSSGSALRAG